MSGPFDHRTISLRKQPLSNGCPFKLLPHSQWVFATAAKPRLMRGLARGEPSGEHPKVRCPECGRRLRLAARYNSGSGEEFSHWEIPDHRQRVLPVKAPKRQSQISGRGK